MATCKDCIYYEFCEYCPFNDINIEKKCEDFKNKANVVEVVRCKECKNAMSPDKHSCYCAKFEEFVLLNDFCSYGERRGKE